MLGDVDAPHAADTKELLDVVPVRNRLPDEWIIGSLQLQRAAVVRAVALLDPVLGTALKADAKGGHDWGWVLGGGCSVLGAGCWVVGARCWVLGSRCWVLGARF